MEIKPSVADVEVSVPGPGKHPDQKQKHYCRYLEVWGGKHQCTTAAL